MHTTGRETERALISIFSLLFTVSRIKLDLLFYEMEKTFE